MLYYLTMWWPIRRGEGSDVSLISHFGGFTESVRASATPALEALLLDQLKTSGPAVAGVAGMLVSPVATVLLRAVLTALAGPPENMMLNKLEALRSAPFARAKVQLSEGMILQPRNSEEAHFQQHRLRAALESLDEAQSLANKGEVLVITFMKTVTASHLVGGAPAALEYARRFGELLSETTDRLLVEITINDRRLQVHQARLKQMVTARPTGAGGGLVGWGASIDPLDRRACERRVALRHRHGETLRRLLSELNWAGEQVRAIAVSLEG